MLRIIRIGLLLLLKLYSNQPGYGMVVALRSACGLGFDYGGIVLVVTMFSSHNTKYQ